MATPFKLKSGNASAFKNLGSSPAKQKPTTSATAGIAELEKLKAIRVANTNAGKIIKFGEASNIIAGKEDFKKELLKKGKKLLKKGKKVAKKVLKAGGKFGGAVFNIMPAPMINPTREKYNKNLEG